MTQKRSRLFRALLCSSALAGITSNVFGQDGVSRVGSGPVPEPMPGTDGFATPDSESGYAQLPTYQLPQFVPPGNMNPVVQPPRPIWQDELGPRFRMETRIGEWLGSSDKGDASANVIMPFAFEGSNTILVYGARGTATYDGSGGISMGGGFRRYDQFRNRVYGITGWWDYDDGNASDYHQVGVSFESLGKWFDFRANGYIGLGDDTNILSATPTGTVTPVGGSLLADVRQSVESQYSGFNVEVGGPMPILGRYGFEAYVGGYHFQSEEDEDASGVSVRLLANVTDDVRLGIDVTRDAVFDTQVFGSVIVTLPDGRPQTWFRPRSVQSKLLDRVERRYRVFAHRQDRIVQVPATGMMMAPMSGGAAAAGAGFAIDNVLYIDSESETNGVGTFEDPANTFVGLAGPGENTLVIVRGVDRDGDGLLNVVTGSLTLADGSVVLGEQYINNNPVTLVTSVGPVALPMLDDSATTPLWVNSTNDPLIRLGNNTEVAGLRFDGSLRADGSTKTGPFSTIITGSDLEGVSIHDNTFFNYGDAAVDLRNVTGTIADGTHLQVYSNNFYGRSGSSLDGFRLINNGPGEVDLELGTTEINLLASGGLARGNVAYGNSGEDANGNGVLDSGEDTIDVNGILDRGAGYRITALNRAVINANVAGNTAVNEVDVNGDGQTNSEDINGNRLLDLGEDTNDNGQLDFGDDLNRNGQLDQGNSQGFVITAGATASTINLTFVDNTADSNIDDGVVLAANASTLNAGTIGEDVDGTGRLNQYADINGDGILEVVTISEDVNLNGILDPGEDLDNDGILDVLVQPFEDFNRNGRLDTTEDTNGNGTLDPGEDLNGDGNLDVFEDTIPNGLLDLTEDVNGNGVLDDGEDLNGDGNLDVFEDLNRNGVLDAGEDIDSDGVLDLVEDLDSDGLLDLVEDLDRNGTLSFGKDANEDTNGNGRLDAGEDVNGDGFLNQGNENGLLDGGQIIRGNTITRNGRNGQQQLGRDGLRVESTNNANVILNVIGNTIGDAADRSTGNGGAGLNITADSGSLVANIGPLYFEDLNFNDVLDPGEDTNGNGSLDTLGAGNQFVANASGGINIELTGTAVGSVQTIGNTVIGTGGGAFDFAAAGDTTGNPFDFVNASAQGIDITNVRWNVAAAGLEFNTNPAAGGNQFAVQGGTDATTGLQSVNGTSDFTVANLATTLDMVFNDFNPRNGVLDAGEDANNNGLLDAGEDLGEQLSFLIDLDPSGMQNMAVTGDQLAGSIIDVTFNTGARLRGTMQLDPSNATGAIFIPETSFRSPGTGIAITASDNAVLQESLIVNNTIEGFGGAGFAAAAIDQGDVQNLIIRGNTITDNGSNEVLTGFSHGIDLLAQNTQLTSNARLTADIFDNTLNGNVAGAINALADGGSLTLSRVEQNVMGVGGGATDNGRGISLATLNAGSLDARITNNQIQNSAQNPLSATTATSGDGIEVLANNGTITLSEIADNIIGTNAGDGLQLDVSNGGTLIVSPSEDLNENGALDAGEDDNEDVNGNGVLDPGEDVNLDGVLNLGNGNGLLDRGLFNNNVVNNSGNSIAVDATDGTVVLGDVVQNVIAYNIAGTGGFAINGANSDIVARFAGNSVTGDPNNNAAGGPGLLVNTLGGSFDVTVGGPRPQDGNIFSLNTGAGIAFTMSDSGTGAFVIENNTITQINDDNDAFTPYQGEGISVNLIGSDTLTDSTAVLTRSDITGNVIGDFTNATLGTAGSGIAVLLSENTTIQDLLISDNLIGNAGNDNPVLGIIPGSFVGDAGIRIDRFDDARLDLANPRTGQLRAVTIADNVVRASGAAGTGVDGLQINVMNGIRDDIDFEINGNEFSGSAAHGVHFNTQADASLQTDLTGNLIEGNALDGVHMSGVEIVTNDLETQGGTWIQNVIRSNGGNGITIDSVSGDIIPLIIGLDGADPVTGQSFGNLIELNSGNGIQIDSGGFAQISNNVIARNGGIGIDINNINVGFRSAVITNNSINTNSGDGLEVLTRGDDITETTIVAFGNSIDGNLGRGVDVLNQPIGGGPFDPVTNLRFGDGTAAGANFITSNGLEGFYVVNTASTTQQQDVPSDQPLDATGDTRARPDIVLDLQRNTISGNNNLNELSGFEGGGLSIRVGSSGAVRGGAVGTIPADITGDVGGSGLGIGALVGVGSNSAIFGNGRVNARVVDNTFNGNLGTDVYIESFTSTGGVNGTQGAWDDMQFNFMGNQNETDPLARLNLVFRGNVGDSYDVTNVGAFYNDADAVFKSRDIMAMNPGPFLNSGRRRNAQRVPDRGTVPDFYANPVGAPDFGLYQYPGIGESTFRIEGDFDTSGFLTAEPLGDFFIDGTPVPPSFNANGVTFGNANVDEAAFPYGWGTAAPGAFQFDDAFLGLTVPQTGN
ncbi:MAG: beta strand repeat-containing protein [Planctomycetota bacterium]